MKRFLVLSSLFFSLLLVLNSWLSMAHAQQEIDVDIDPLTVSIAPPTYNRLGGGTVPDRVKNGPFDVNITFNKSVTGFVQEDVLLTDNTAEATITAWEDSGDNQNYTATITPTSSGSVSISIPAEAAADDIGNLSTASNTYTTTVDIDPPTVTITLPEDEQTGDFTITLIVSEPILRFRYWAVSARDGTATARFSDWTSSEDTLTHTATVTPIGTGELHISLRDRAVADLAGNYNVASEEPSTIDVVDITPPRVTIFMREWKQGDFLVDAYFDELVVGFTQEDISFTFALVGGEEDEDASATFDGWLLIGDEDGSYGARMTVTEVQGTIEDIRILADAVEDTSGNGNIASDDEDDTAGSPESPDVLEAQLERLLAESDGSAKYLNAITQLETLLAEPRPDETALLANYPNPFNPETWIPYHLANPSEVQITIYDTRGSVVRRLELGHQLEGYYTNRSRAAYWDGRNDLGERVASGIYFYRLQADNQSLLRKLVILK